MKHLILIFFTAAIFLFPSVVQAAPGDNREAIFTKTDDFRLHYATDQGYFNCKLRCTYISKDRQYTLVLLRDINRPDTLAILEDPLNYDFFAGKLFEGLRKKDTSIRPISNESIRTVFAWVYTLNSDTEDDEVTSGVLWLKQWIMVSPGQLGLTRHKPREKVVDSLTRKYGAIQIYTQTLANDLDTLISRNVIASGTDTNVTFKAMAYATFVWLRDKNELQTLMSARGQFNEDNLKSLQKIKDGRAAAQKLIDSLGKARSSAPADSEAIDEKIKELEKTRKLTDAEQAQLETLTIQKAKYDETGAAISNLRKQIEIDSAEAARTREWNTKEIEKAKAGNKNAGPLTTILNRLHLGIYSATHKPDEDLQAIQDTSLKSNIKAAFERYLDKSTELIRIDDELSKSFIHPVRRISILFERGYIERIQAWIGNGQGGEDIYENIYAIGVTSINNLRAMDDIRLFIRRSSGNDYIYLSDLFGNYDNFLANLTRDYSPADTALNNILPSAQPRITLRKERIINLFDAKIYTDFAGLQESSPNGLIQTEVARRFNIHSYRGQIVGTRQDFGTFNYLYAYGALTKLENKERRLPVRNENIVENNTLVSPSYTSNLDLRRYENLSMGLNLNLLLYDNPDWKYTVYVDAGLRYGHIPVVDSIRTIVNGVVDTPRSFVNRDAHTVTLELPRITLELFSERRVGVTFSYQYNFTRLYSNFFKQVVSYEKSDLTAYPVDRYARHMHSFETLLRVETSRSNNGRLFFRARFFWQRGDVNTFFPQLQLGYAYNLLFRK